MPASHHSVFTVLSVVFAVVKATLKYFINWLIVLLPSEVLLWGPSNSGMENWLNSICSVGAGGGGDDGISGTRGSNANVRIW